jgi:hypothetical protein
MTSRETTHSIAGRAPRTLDGGAVRRAWPARGSNNKIDTTTPARRPGCHRQTVLRTGRLSTFGFPGVSSRDTWIQFGDDPFHDGPEFR